MCRLTQFYYEKIIGSSSSIFLAGWLACMMLLGLVITPLRSLIVSPMAPSLSLSLHSVAATTRGQREREREREREHHQPVAALGTLGGHTGAQYTRMFFGECCWKHKQNFLKCFDFRDIYVWYLLLQNYNSKIGISINLVYSRCSNCGKIDTVIDHQKQLFAL